MKNAVLLLVVCILFTGLIAGCGGGTSTEPSPYVGHWRGAISDGSKPEAETLDIEISSGSSFAGKVYNGRGEVIGRVSGTLSKECRMEMNYRYFFSDDRAEPRSIGNVTIISNQMAGTLTAQVTPYISNKQTIGLRKQPF